MNISQWIEQQKKRISAQPLVGYAPGAAPAAEPVAFAAMAALTYGFRESAESACQCLRSAQNGDGSVAVQLGGDGPFWTTALACIAWRRFELAWAARARSWCRDAYLKGLDFLLSTGGEKVEWVEGERLEANETLGHDTQLVGWPWVQGTHSWVEPTAMALLALRHCGRADHPRAIEAAELLIDRLLPDGGANYGNTFVLGQQLRPHVQPSAISLVALTRGQPRQQRMTATLDYLRRALSSPLAGISLAWTIAAIVSAEELPDSSAYDFEKPLQAVIEREQHWGQNPHRQNMLLLAMSLGESPLLDLPEFPIPNIQVPKS